MWDDPEIRNINPGLQLPHRKILPVASAGDSGDASIITEAFSSFDKHWKEHYGVFTDPKFVGGYCCNSTSWPKDVITLFGKRSVGMIGIVGSVPYTVGYIASTFATDMDVPSASLLNQMGYEVPPSTATVKSAIAYSKLHNNPASASFSLSNAQSKDAYPMVAFTYFVFNISTTPGITCCQMEELCGFVEWVLSRSTKFLESQGAVAVTDHVADTVIRVILGQTRCGSEIPYNEYKKSLIEETAMSSWKIGLIVALTVVTLGGVAFILFLILQKRGDDAKSQNWIIDGGEVKRLGQGSSGSSVSFKSLAGLKAEYDHSPAMLCEIAVVGPSRWSNKTKKQVLFLLKNVNHSAVLPIIGITSLEGVTYVLSELPGKGTLRHSLLGSKFDLHGDFKMALSMNLLQGLSYLHSKSIIHGLLNSQTCYIDSSWTLRIGQWLDLAIYQKENPHGLLELVNTNDPATLTEVELLRLFYLDPRAFQGLYDKATDIFSLGLLVFEVFTFNKDSKYSSPQMMEILANKMKYGTSELPPVYVEYPRSVEFLVRMCLGEPLSRPTIDVMMSEIKKLRTTTKEIVDMLMETMETYAARLEQEVNARTTELTAKSAALEEMTNKMEELLHEVLPPAIAAKLLAGEKVEPEFFENVTIFFADIVGFTDISSRSSPYQVMDFLNSLWKLFDSVLVKFDVYKVDTIGDAYMVCSGLPERNGLNHVKEICEMSLMLLRACHSFKFAHLDQKLQVRVGINSGPVTTGID